MSDLRESVLAGIGTAVALAALLAIGAAVLDDDLESTWPETAEFRELANGGDRWSEHETNLSDAFVIVDHSTGVTYLCTDAGICAMVDEDGKPIRELEAG